MNPFVILRMLPAMVKVVVRRIRLVMILLSVNPKEKNKEEDKIVAPAILSKSTMNAEARSVLKVRKWMQNSMML